MIMRVSLHPYALRLVAPIRLKGVQHESRRGVLLRVEDERGRAAWGDCAPLPGFSRETLEESTTQLRAQERWIAEQRPETGWGEPAHPLHTEIDSLGLEPSARFALDLALLDLAAQVAGRPLPALLHPDPGVAIPLNALLTGDHERELLRSAEARVARGYRTLKIKVGRDEVARDVQKIRAMRQLVGPDVGIRCDANQAWSFAEACDFADGVQGLGIEYVEEPLADPRELGKLWFDTMLPIALDESLAGLDPADLAGKGYAVAAVLKATLLGGMLRTLAFARQARSLGIRPVISGAFESGVAMRGHVALAAATGGQPAGLDPYNYLREDVLQPRLRLDIPLVDVPALFDREHRVVTS
jgi:o-succinylbenzoate synthase